MPARRAAKEEDAEETPKPKARRRRKPAKKLLKGAKDQAAKRKEKKPTVEKDLPPLVRRAKAEDEESPFVVDNPASYRRLQQRLQESSNGASRDGGRPEKGRLVESAWKCTLCRKATCVEDLGDLFGPFYLNLSHPDVWPHYVDKPDSPKPSPKKKRRKSGEGAGDKAEEAAPYLEAWLHGDCVLWAPGLLLRGPRLTGLEENLPVMWDQKCVYCGELGAGVECSAPNCARAFHFPCGRDSKAEFQEESLAAWCANHAAHGRQKKLKQ